MGSLCGGAAYFALGMAALNPAIGALVIAAAASWGHPGHRHS
ncbi:hypothetical protein [Arthrobacter caoxuetaonis]|nr:hypothetical protein [Arthrobacter caoxuetaonis]